MAWPTTAELTKRLNLVSGEWDDPHMDRLIAAGIAWAKAKVGDWNEDTDAPDEALAQAALERAVEQATTGDSPAGSALPRKSESLLYGHRRRFGIG